MSINNEKFSMIKRGEIYYADLGENGVGSEQNGMRPVLIIQNNKGNMYSSTTIVALITSVNKKMRLPVHVEIDKDLSGLPKDSVILLEQLRTIDKKRLIRKVSTLESSVLDAIELALNISLGI